MTAIIVYQAAGAVHVLTDGAAFGPDGRACMLMQKVHAVAHLKAVVAPRGPALFAGLFKAIIDQQQGDFDLLVQRVADLAADAATRMTAALEASPQKSLWAATALDLVLAGWSAKRRRPEAYLVERTAVSGTWTCVELSNGRACQYVSPGDEGLEARLRARGIDLWAYDSGDLNPAEHGLAVMQEQRRCVAEGGVAPSDACPVLSSWVGGFCQITSVSEHALVTRILEEWPEDITVPANFSEVDPGKPRPRWRMPFGKRSLAA